MLLWLNYSSGFFHHCGSTKIPPFSLQFSFPYCVHPKCNQERGKGWLSRYIEWWSFLIRKHPLTDIINYSCQLNSTSKKWARHSSGEYKEEEKSFLPSSCLQSSERDKHGHRYIGRGEGGGELDSSVNIIRVKVEQGIYSYLPLPPSTPSRIFCSW